MTTTPVTPLKTPWREVLLAALPAALHAVLLLGRLHPDEVYQSLEPAMHRAFGYGIVAWEWQVPPDPSAATQPWGIRNWAVPGLFAALFRAGDAVGLRSVMARRLLAELPQVLLHAAMLAAVWRFSARRVGAPLARWCLWLVALYGPLVWFAGRTMSEAWSVAFLVWGLERLDDEAAGPRAWALAGALLGFAQVTRYGSAAVIAPAMLWLLVTRRWGAFGWATLTGLGVAVALGALDRLTWGEWWHSFIHYVRFNVVSSAAADTFGRLPPWYYLQRLYLAPWALLGFLAWRQRPGARAWLVVVAALGYLAAISATAHKEDRFVYPTLVLLTLAATPAFVAWAREAAAGWRRWAAGLAVAGNLAFFIFDSPFAPRRKEQFQLAVKASEGATGLVVMNEGLWGAGGYFYLGKDVPWCTCDAPHERCFQMAARDPRFNRGLFWTDGTPGEVERDAQVLEAFTGAGFHVVERRGGATFFAR